MTAKGVGEHVEDSAGRVGILRAVIKDYADPADPPRNRPKRPTAFIWPETDGCEWLVPPTSVKRV